ncbi:MAG: PucR family transcriptional regulator [Sedimentibacter sp.]
MHYGIKERIASANYKFLSSLMIGGLQPIVKSANEIFNSPVVVVDSAGKCICQVPDIILGEENWDEYISEKAVSLEENLKAQGCYSSNKRPDSNIVYITDENVTGAPYLMGQFFENDIIAGHFGILLRGKVPDEVDFEIAELFSKVLSSFYTNSINPISKIHFHNAYILDLLKGVNSHEYISLPGWNFKSVIKPEFVVLVSPISEKEKNRTISYCVCDYISKRFKGVFPVVFEDNIVIVCCGLLKGISRNPCSSNKLKGILDCLSSYNYTTGISNGFSEIAELKAYFNQALITVKIGMKLKPEKGIHLFNDYSPLQMFFPISELSLQEIWIHPVILEMRDYDKIHNTEYFNTFKEYILSSRDKKESAKMLNIHINTLNYRLEKIEDIFKISQLQKKDYLHLICSFLLYELNI